MIQPITQSQQQRVIDHSMDVLLNASVLLKKNFKPLPILFDLKGKAAGMYCRRGGKCWIRFNPYIFAKYFVDNLENTVTHEIAHYVVDIVYGKHRVRPHGKEWVEVMQLLGVDPQRTCEYDLEGIPTKVHQLFEYVCGCRQHQLGSRRHKKIERGQAQYFCKQCQQKLAFDG